MFHQTSSGLINLYHHLKGNQLFRLLIVKAKNYLWNPYKFQLGIQYLQNQRILLLFQVALQCHQMKRSA